MTNRLVLHTPLMRLVRDEEDSALDPDIFSRENEYYLWSPCGSPGIYRDTTPVHLAQLIMTKEESFNRPEDGHVNRVFDKTRSYPLNASSEAQIEIVTFKVELKTDFAHSFFWPHISYARENPWSLADATVVSTYDE